MNKDRKIKSLKNRIEYCKKNNSHKKICKMLEYRLEALIKSLK